MLYVTITVLVGMIILLAVLLCVERSRAIKREDNMLNRIMSRNYNEYQNLEIKHDIAKIDLKNLSKMKPEMPYPNQEDLYPMDDDILPIA